MGDSPAACYCMNVKTAVLCQESTCGRSVASSVPVRSTRTVEHGGVSELDYKIRNDTS